ncbi:hypothetical protein ACQ4PT_025158 [Festuca glaucescens]
MTVGRGSSDGAGDPACPSPESIGTATSPAPTSRSKFWADSESSDEGSNEGIVGDAPSGSQVSLRYICRSPTPEEYDGDRFQEADGDGGFGNGGFGNFNRGTGYGNNGRRGYANQYQREGGFQNRNQTGGGGYRGGNNRNNNGGGTAVTRRDGGIDQDFIQQTVQEVVAAVAAASQKSAIPAEAITVAEVVALGLVSMQPVIPPVALPVVSPAVQPVPVPSATATTEDGATAAKKKKSDSCFRCKQPGHFIDDCTVPMCDICESVNHASNVCHLLQAPKPTVAMYGYANEALMFFELPLRGTYRPKVENAKLAKLTIEGDAMTIPEIIEQLKWIVPSENFQWEVTHFHNNVFKVKFPNKNEVQRMKHFKTYPVPLRATDMEFDEWSVMEEPTFMLPEVWLRVTGIPADVRNDFLALWALGSLFGKTMEVDMSFTRKNKVLRLRIGCMDATLIPGTKNVYISRGFFRLAFEVEKKNANAEVEMVEAAQNNGNNNDGNGGGEGNRGNENNKDEAINMEVEQTINPGVNQGPNGSAGNQRSGANSKQNQMMVTFGTLPPSPIKDDVLLPCVFRGEAGSAQSTEMTQKIEPKRCPE